MEQIEQKVYSNKVFVKYLPKQLPIDELSAIVRELETPARNFEEILPYGSGRAMLCFATPKDAVASLQPITERLQKLDPYVHVEVFKKNPPKPKKPYQGAVGAAAAGEQEQSQQQQLKSSDMPKISKYVAKLYSCNGSLGFDQPPPPYLRYCYPRITPDILDGICIALMSNTRFYTQVLHLMNRMNLEPPFGERDSRFEASRDKRHTATQTEDNQQRVNDDDSESEMELSGEELVTSGDRNSLKRRLPAVNDELYKKRARQLLQQAASQRNRAKEKAAMAVKREEIFESPMDATAKPPKIELKLEKKLEQHRPPASAEPSTAERLLTAAEMSDMAIFKHYCKGEPCNKLYIKNLAKTVNAEDLRGLYGRFVDVQRLDVKVMQQGRMKGQAFVTFGPDPSGDPSGADVPAIAETALLATNGLVWQQKPMVVSYGRK